MPFKRHNPGCPCCDDISSSSSSVPSSSSISSSSSSSSSSVIDPCDCTEADITYYLKITINHPQELEQYETQFSVFMCANCRPVYRTNGYTAATGTYFIPLIRQCNVPDPGDIRFVLGEGTLLTVAAGSWEQASCARGVISWTFLGVVDYGFARRSASLNQILDITYIKHPFLGGETLHVINIDNLDLCTSAPTLSGSHTWPALTKLLPNDPGSPLFEPCSNSVTHNFEPLLWEIVPGVV